MAVPPKVDLLRLSATELQSLLQNGELSSVDLIKQSLKQINLHNEKGLKLKAIISVAPEHLVLEQAAKLDEERARGDIRGPFHGIPILLKDVIKTDSALGMPTTLGSFALANATTKKSASIVDKLIEKGLIIIGKTNLNVRNLSTKSSVIFASMTDLCQELSSWKAMGPMNGWSAVGGQTNSAYIEGGVDLKDGVMSHTNPCGASTGSAVSVSAGFSPVALGTEVDGSLTQPAARAALYALKPSIGSTDLEGIFEVSKEFDSLGGMAKTTLDLAHLSELVLNSDARAALPKDGYLSFLKKDFSGLKIGFVDPEKWRWPESVQPQYENSAAQLKKGYLRAIELVKGNLGETVYPVSVPPASDFIIDGQPSTIMAIRHVFKDHVDAYLSSLSTSDVRTAEDIAQFNKDNAELELPADFPEQGRLLDTLENPVNEEQYERAFKHSRTVGRDLGIDKTLEDNKLDLVAFPMDSPCPRVACAAGYPIATVPVGKLDYKGRPFGLAIIAKAGREDLLFSFMSAFEAVSEPRAVPPRLAA